MRLQEIRKKRGLSQEKLAELLDVTRQAIQKWESGASKPDLDNLIALTRQLHVSADVLLGDDPRTVEELRLGRPLIPAFESMHVWDAYQSQLPFEWRQCMMEGMDFERYRDIFEAATKLEPGTTKERIANELFDFVLNTPLRPDWPYDEPDTYEEIAKRFSNAPCALAAADGAALGAKIRGAWMGRICGCLLGKPLECRHTDVFHPLLMRTNNFPLKRYLRASDFTEEDRESFHLEAIAPMLVDSLECAPSDDDTNYTVLSALIIEEYGARFRPTDVAESWIRFQGKNAYCTAERVAYRNFIAGYRPPQSAAYKNPYREWIGAQIRTDYYGYICPGNPERAAHMAWRDASISHVKNGIYGAMYISAMLAAAACKNMKMEQVIAWGLSQIPSTSRLHEALQHILQQYKAGESAASVIAGIHKRYNEHDQYDWCFVIPNAEIITASLLYGQNDFSKGICMAVQAGFDTDCNGATVGSVIGMLRGEECIGTAWSDPVNGMLDTSILGMGRVKVEDMVQMTLRHISLYA